LTRSYDCSVIYGHSHQFQKNATARDPEKFSGRDFQKIPNFNSKYHWEFYFYDLYYHFFFQQKLSNSRLSMYGKLSSLFGLEAFSPLFCHYLIYLILDIIISLNRSLSKQTQKYIYMMIIMIWLQGFFYSKAKPLMRLTWTDKFWKINKNFQNFVFLILEEKKVTFGMLMLTCLFVICSKLLYA